MKAVMPFASLAIGCLAVVSLSACGDAAKSAADVKPLDFNVDIRPILSQNCFRCHGPDAETRKAGLRLDQPRAAYAILPKMPGQRAIVPDRPDQSEVVRRITSKDPDYRMPHNLAPLSQPQIDKIVAWIKQGAHYEKQWSLIPPEQVTPPYSKFDALTANPIDHFVFAKLASDGLIPSNPADRATLIRRVSLTLTGLPPTIADVDAFVHDQSSNAYEKVVDRLLASPAYGEHLAGMWMDLARWANTDGYLDDHHDRFLWPWRDWAIQAFNSNMPYNQFGTDQLAGDLIPNHTRDQLLATAFLRLGQRTTENGALNEQFRINAVVDKTNTVGTVFLGYTVGCAECHDHKYDPISQKDYYSFSGFFNSNDEPGVYAPGFEGLQAGPTLPWPTPAQAAQLRTAQTLLDQRATAYANTWTQASRAVQPTATAMLRNQGPGVVKTLLTTSQRMSSAKATSLVNESLRQAQVAYYPFDSVEPIPPSAYGTLKLPPAPLPPAGLGITLALPQRPVARGPAPSKASGGAANKAANPFAALLESPTPNTYTLKYMRFSPSGMPGVGPAAILEPKLGPGVQGHALYFTETNKGYLARGVGDYDRTQQFSFDFWFKPGSAYSEDVPIFDHSNVKGGDTWETNTSGYELNLSHQRLVFYLSHVAPRDMIAVSTNELLALKQWSHIAVTYDGSSRASGVRIYVNGKLQALTIIRDNLTRTIIPLGSTGSTSNAFDPYVGLAFGTRFRSKAPVDSALDEFRVFKRALTPLEVSYLDEGAKVLSQPNAAESLVDLLAIRDPQVERARMALDQARAQENQVASSIPEVLVEGDTPTPRPTHLLNRGLYDQPTDQVPVQGLDQLFAWARSLPSNRIGLAEWLFDSHNPLTARVFVNDLWQLNFGTGIVKTANDFGSQGDYPTHLQLLDWLAVDFMQHGWNIKRLEKMIVMSATFRQASDATPAQLARDPQNALLARGPRFRMDGRMIRDSVLEESGLLVDRIGGPSAYPYQPDGIWSPDITAYIYPKPDQVAPDELHRRTLYTFVKRNALNPQLQLLDAADPTVSIARLSVSNTPMQSLLMLNSPQYVEAYRMMAEHALQAGGNGADPNVLVTSLYRAVRQRLPSSDQLSVLHGYYEERLQHYSADPTAAESLIKVGVTPNDSALDTKKTAALTDVAALVFDTPDSFYVQ